MTSAKTVTADYASARLSIVKDTSGGDGGNFIFTSPQVDLDKFIGEKNPLITSISNPSVSRVATNLPVGTYSLTESNIPTGYSLNDASCVNAAGSKRGTFNPINKTIENLDLVANDEIICTFKNVWAAPPQKGTLMIIKNSGDGKASFEYKVVGPEAWDFSIDTTQGASTSKELSPGTDYSITETWPSGWQATNASCGGSESFSSDSSNAKLENIKVEAGETTVCTFYNIVDGGGDGDGDGDGGDGDYYYTDYEVNIPEPDIPFRFY